MANRNQLRDRKVYSTELKLHIVKQIERGELGVTDVCRAYGVKSRDTVYKWIYKYSRSLEKGTLFVVEKDSLSKKLAELERRNKELEAALGRKQMESDFYRTMIELAEERHGISIKKEWRGTVERLRGSYTLTSLCGFWRDAPGILQEVEASKGFSPSEITTLTQRALRERSRCPETGCRTIAEGMPEGWSYGRLKTEKMLLSLGFGVKRKGKYVITTTPGKVRLPNLTLGLELTGVNQLWSSDMTYFHTQDGKVNYLIFIVDCYSQKVISHGVYSDYPAENFLEVLNKAVKLRPEANLKKLIFHSDRGSQYGSDLFRGRLKDLEIRQSMCIYSWENPIAEKTNDLIKNRYLRHWNPRNIRELKAMTSRAVKHHNTKATKRKLGRMSPDQYETMLTEKRINQPKTMRPLKQYGYKLVPASCAPNQMKYIQPS